MLIAPGGEISNVNLEERDPVILVHGVSGRYPSWGNDIGTVRSLTGHLADEGYDGWQFYYPENQDITKSGPLLAKAIHRLQNTLGYGTGKTFDIVAHSMGGLVSRHFVQEMGIGRGRESYSQVLGNFPDPGTAIDKFLMLGTPNHGSYASWRCTGAIVSTCVTLNLRDDTDFDKDVGAPAYRQMSPGSRFLDDINSSANFEVYSPTSSLVLAGTRNPGEASILSDLITFEIIEIPNQDDNAVAVSSASLLDMGVPLAIGDFVHSGGFDRDEQYDPRINEDTKDIITNFLSSSYSPGNPQELGDITGFWALSSPGDPVPVISPPDEVDTEEGVLTVNAEGTSVASISILNRCDLGGEFGTCLRIGGKKGMKKVPKQNRFFSHSANPKSLGFSAATGLSAGNRSAVVQKKSYDSEWKNIKEISIETKPLQTTQVRLDFNDVQRLTVEASSFARVVRTLNPFGNGLVNSSKSTSLKAGQTAESQFQVDTSTDTLSFWLTQDSAGSFAGHNMRLVTPDGAVIDSSTAKSESGLGYTQNLNIGSAIYLVSDPAPGRWTVLHDASVPATVSAPVRSAVGLNVSIPDSSFATGEVVPVTVSFSNQNTYQNKQVSAHLYIDRPTGGKTTKFGTFDLSETGPTRFQGDFSPPYVGTYSVAIDFSAKIGGESVLRRAVETVTVIGDSTNTPPEPPPAPTDLSIQFDGAEGVALSWSAGGGRPFEEYRVYRDTIPNPVRQVARVSSVETSYTDTDIQGGQIYYYRVTAAGTGGVESAFTTGASIFTYPSSLSVDFQRAFGSPSSEEGYRLVALPGAVDEPLQTTISGEAGTDWKAVWDNGADQNYFQEYDGSDAFRFAPGRGFWLISSSDWSVEETFETVDLVADTAATIDLHDDWNIIANPLDKNVSWSAVEKANGGTLQALWSFDGSFSEAPTFASAKSGEAFYFMNDKGLDQLTIPYPGAPQKREPVRDAEKSGKNASTRKTLALTTLQNGQRTSAVKVGTAPGAEEGLDPRDQFAPPGRFEAASLRLQVPETVASERLQLLVHEFRPADGPGRTFELVLSGAPGKPVTIQAGGLEDFGSQKVALIDKQSGRPYDLQAQPRVTLTPQTKTTEFRLAVGTEAFVANEQAKVTPERLELHPNYPNPFDGRTTVEYALPERTDVRIEVYNILGRRVRVLRHSEQRAGFYRIRWNGRNSAGQPVASGLYFIRLKALGKLKTEKVTLVR